MQDNILQLKSCNIKKQCNKEIKNKKTIMDEWLKNSRINYDNYINKKY
jgi:hypothetical protein